MYVIKSCIFLIGHMIQLKEFILYETKAEVVIIHPSGIKQTGDMLV